MALYDGRNLRLYRYKGRNLIVNGTVVTFEVAHRNSQIYNRVTFDVGRGYDDSKHFHKGITYYFTPSSTCYTIENGNKKNMIEYVCVTYNLEGSGLARIEINFEGKGSAGKDWDVRFGDSVSLKNLGKIPNPDDVTGNSGDATGGSGNGGGVVKNPVTPPTKKPVVPQIPGMPADFAKNPNNVKIAQLYLVKEGANLSTSKSVSGVDGILGPLTGNAILAYMSEHSCDFNKFWQDAQEYYQKKKNVDSMKAQNLQAQMQQVQNLKLNKPNIGNQQQVQNLNLNKPNIGNQQQVPTVNEVRTQFFDMLNRINNATILQ